MLPWEHAAIAYLLYSGYSRWQNSMPPHGWAVLVVLFASQLPDLIDKPLMWYSGILPSGRSLAHSVLIAVPVVIIVSELARNHDVEKLGPAFAIGYLSHLGSEALPLYPGREASFESILWPVLEYEPSSDQYGSAVEWGIETLISDYPTLLELNPTIHVMVGISTVTLMFLVWMIDGKPGLRETWMVFRWPLNALGSVVFR